uniref:NAD(P)-dependent oxidoreductase n=1 Tax=Bordetella sputigena TaxID=1416810 RepID=UPI0039EF55C7
MRAQTLSGAPALAIVGFGEVGPILAKALAAQGCQVAAYDIKLDDPATRAQIEQRAAASGARVAASLSDCLAGAELVFSAVTASQARAVAESAAPLMRPGQTFIDLNSVSPKVKQQNSALIQRHGADYVESAVMAPVPPQGIRVPMLLGGRGARAISARLNALGMRTEAVADDIGLASAIKLCRSIMIKGMEAMCVQSMLAARHFGVDDRVLASMAASFPSVGWDEGYEAYLIGRVAEHGQRRSEEMREAAAMLAEIGMNPALATSIADIQQALARKGASLHDQLDAKGRLPQWRTLLTGGDAG